MGSDPLLDKQALFVCFPVHHSLWQRERGPSESPIQQRVASSFLTRDRHVIWGTSLIPLCFSSHICKIWTIISILPNFKGCSEKQNEGTLSGKYYLNVSYI